MPTTTRLALPYPTPDDNPEGPAQIQALAEKLDAVVAIPDAGDLKFSARVAEHGNWIKSDGRALAAGVYPNLRAALIADGSPYGSSSGNPKLPDMKGRAPVGAGAGAGLTARTAGQAGGAETHQLTVAEMPAHQHTPPDPQRWLHPGIPPTFPAGTGNQGLIGDASPSEWAGGNGAHNNMSPFTVGTWFVYAG